MTSAACCTGNVHPGDPKGTTGTMHGVSTYISEPPNGAEVKGIVVMIPDAFGWEFVNLRLLADSFAERIGVRCLLPEFMDGKAANPSGFLTVKAATNSSIPWYSKIIEISKTITILGPFMYQCRFSVCWPRIESLFKSLRESTSLPIGVIGYCWGGKHALTLAQTPTNTPLITAAYTAHPSNLVIPVDIEKLNLPVSISHGTEDIVVSNADAKKIEDVFAKKEKENAADGGKYEIKIVKGAKHGFACRGDPNDEAELGHAQVAEDQAVEWFERWLVGRK